MLEVKSKGGKSAVFLPPLGDDLNSAGVGLKKERNELNLDQSAKLVVGTSIASPVTPLRMAQFIPRPKTLVCSYYHSSHFLQTSNKPMKF